MPPKGSSGVEATMALTKTMPGSIRSMHRALLGFDRWSTRSTPSP